MDPKRGACNNGEMQTSMFLKEKEDEQVFQDKCSINALILLDIYVNMEKGVVIFWFLENSAYMSKKRIPIFIDGPKSTKWTEVD